MSVEATVDKFYLAVLDRQAEPEGRTHWIGKIRSGMSLQWKVADSFVVPIKGAGRIGTAPIHWPYALVF